MRKLHTKQGIASFYMVAIATLLLSVFTVGFTTYVVNEINRTTNFDLSKSAYDSALAGIEDAKLAIMNYRSCIAKGKTAAAPNGDSTITCEEIIYFMENPDCFMVGHILGRIPESVNGEVMIREDDEKGNNMKQAYTCVKITNPKDYRTRLNSGNSTRVIPIKIKNGNISDIKTIRVSWGDNSGVNYNNTISTTPGYVEFPSLNATSASNPPLLSIQLIQTGTEFKLSDFDISKGNQTDRGTIYLAPSNGKTNKAEGTVTDTNIDVTKTNKINANIGFIKSNDKTSKNLPFLVNCPKDSDQPFLCSVSIGIPDPISTTGRSEDTFAIVLSLPYGGPDTDVAVSACTSADVCEAISDDDNITTGSSSSTAVELTTQTRIDSTGRANNLFRRIESRVETTTNQFYSYSYDAIQALGNTTETTIRKTVTSNTEVNFPTAPEVYAGLNTYTLRFSANTCPGAYNIPATQTIRENTTAKFYIANVEPHCNNYNFVGWGTTANATTGLYRPNQVFTMKSTDGLYDRTLYAIWEAQKFTITYHPYNNANEVLGTQVVSYGVPTTVYSSVTKPSIFNSYTLYGWSTQINSTNAEYIIGDSSRNKITATHNIDLYAVWRKEKVFNFYQLDGSNSQQKAYFYNEAQTATIIVPQVNSTTISGKTTYTKGWSKSHTSYQSASFTAGANAIVSPNDATTYYAAAYYVTQVKYIIEGHLYVPDQEVNKINYVYVVSKGSTTSTPKYNISAGGIILPNVPKSIVRGYVTGYELDCWRAGQNGTCYPINKTINNLTADMIYYAKLKPSTFTVTFKSYDGNRTYGTQDFLYGTDTNIRGVATRTGWNTVPNDDAPSGKTFYGWSYNKNSKTKNFNNGHTVTTAFNNDGIVLYAVWNKELVAHFNSNNGDDKKSVIIFNGETSGKIGVPHEPDMTGLTKAGWSASNSTIASAISATAHDRWISQNENWYAAYNKTVTITYNKTDSAATGSTANSQGTANVIYSKANTKQEVAAQIPLSESGFALVGRQFSHWNIGSTAGTAYNAGVTYSTTTDVTVYANWTRKIYEVALDKNISSSYTSTVASPTSKIYVVYGSHYGKNSDGSSQLSATSNNITVPGMQYKVTLHYTTGTTTSSQINATFNGYYKGTTQVINPSGLLAADNVSKIFFNDSTPVADRKFVASWGSGSMSLSPEQKTNYTCQWRIGSTSGTVAGSTISISANTDLYSTCKENNYTVTFEPSSDGYISTSSTPGGTKVTTASIVAQSDIIVNGNEISFAGNTTKYYAHANEPDAYTFNGYTNASGKLSADRTISASWTLTNYTITITSDPSSGNPYFYEVGQSNAVTSIVVPAKTAIGISGASIEVYLPTGTRRFWGSHQLYHYHFSYWRINGTYYYSDSYVVTGNATFEMNLSEDSKSWQCSEGSRTSDSRGSSTGGYICVRSAEQTMTDPGGECNNLLNTGCINSSTAQECLKDAVGYLTGVTKCADSEPSSSGCDKSGMTLGSTCTAYYWRKAATDTCSGKSSKLYEQLSSPMTCVGVTSPSYRYDCPSGWSYYDGSGASKRCYSTSVIKYDYD